MPKLHRKQRGLCLGAMLAAARQTVSTQVGCARGIQERPCLPQATRPGVVGLLLSKCVFFAEKSNAEFFARIVIRRNRPQKNEPYFPRKC